jgi:two-component system, LytTR family, sensor kinase
MVLRQASGNASLIAQSWGRGFIQFAFWTFIGLLSASQYYSFLRFENQSIPLWRILVWQMPGWYLWGILAPAILFLGKRFRLEKSNWVSSFALHLTLSLILALGHLTVIAFFRWEFRPPSPYPFPFVGVWFSTFAGSFHIDLLLYFVILGVGYSLEFYRKYKERELAAAHLERQLAQSQLQALRMQLHPHFLFNALHAVSVLVRKQENRTAVRMISGLSDLLRYVLQQGDVQLISLRQEMEFIGQYLELEQLRFQDRLTVQLHVATDTLDAKVPNLILQPLVENAIRHGLAASSDAGLIEIKTWHDKGRLWLQVRDDGPGVVEVWRPEQSSGLGLSNTIGRLARLYGETYEFALTNAEGSGAVVKIGIPFQNSFPSSEVQES